MGILSLNSIYNNNKLEPVQSGLITHLDASDVSTIIRDGSNRVSAWNTKTGNGTNYTQGAEARQPILEAPKTVALMAIDALTSEVEESFINPDGFNDIVRRQKQVGDKIYCVGDFTTYNGVTANRIIRLNLDGSIDNAFSTGVGVGFNAAVRDIHIDGSTIYCVGNFTTYKGTTQNRIVALDTNGQIVVNFVFSSGTGFNNVVQTMLIYTKNSVKYIVAGGNFTSYDGQTRNRVIRITTNGANEPYTAFSSFNGTVWTIKIQSDGKFLFSGQFTSYGLTTRNRLIRINDDYDLNFPLQPATADTTLDIGTGFNATVFTIFDFSPYIVCGGSFTSFNGTTRNRIAAVNITNGSLMSEFYSGVGFNADVYIIDRVSNTNWGSASMFIGGNFTTYNNQPYSKLLRLITDGNVDTNFNTIGRFSDVNYVNNFLFVRDPITNIPIFLLAGGNFTYTNIDKITGIFFDGTDDFLELGANANYVSDVQTTFIVCKPTFINSGISQVLFRHAYDTNQLLTGFFSQATFVFHGRNSANTIISSGITLNQPGYEENVKSLLLGEWRADDTVLLTSDEVITGALGTGANNNPTSHTRSRIGATSSFTVASFWQGEIQEILFYNRQLDRQEIRDNWTYLNHKWFFNTITGDYFSDLFGLPAAAFSLRKLTPNTIYSGAAIRVRRSVGTPTEMDIPFVNDEPNAGIDTAELLAFVGAGDGFVKTWYNQNGTSNHVTQNDTAKQPQIVQSGVVSLENGKPAITFNGSNQYFEGGNIFNIGLNNNFSGNSVCKMENNNAPYSKAVAGGIINRYSLVTDGGNTVSLLHDNVNNAVSQNAQIATLYANQRLYNQEFLVNKVNRLYVDGANVATFNGAISSVGTSAFPFLVGGYNLNGTDVIYHLNGTMQELIMYIQPTNLPPINQLNGNINNFYNIF